MDFRPIDDLAAGQRGVVSHAQLLHLGLTERMIRTRVHSSQFTNIHRGVYRLAGTAPSWEQKVHAAVLAIRGDALISHRAAAAWWGLERADTDVVELVVVEGDRVRLNGVLAHQSNELAAADRSTHHGLPVTSIERTLIDLGRYRRSAEVGRFLDLAVRDGLTTYPRFAGRVGELARSGRNGIGVARLVLEDRGFGDGWGFEKAMRTAIRSAGLPKPCREFRVRVGGTTYRDDFAFPHAMVGVECDSTAWHGSQYQHDADLRRQNRIQHAGLLLMRYTSRRLRDDPAGVTEEIRAAVLARSGVGLGPSATFPDA